MSISCFLSVQTFEPDPGVTADPGEPDDQNREVLDLIRDKAATARDFYRRTHAIVQEAQRLIEQASARTKDAEVRARATEIALRAAEERACRAEARIVQLTAQIGVHERRHPAPATKDVGQAPADMRRARPTMPIRATAKTHEDAAVRRIWPFR